MKTELVGLSKEEIRKEIETLGEKKFRADQLWQWIYFHGAADFDKMTSFSKDFREKLKQNYTITRPKIVTEQISGDGTRKWLLEFSDGQRVETVYIPEEDRGAICISTQVGCGVGCKFCHTGSQKITRNLTAGEIVSQFMVARDVYDEWPSPSNGSERKLSNIVVMGMGEPLHNTENTIKALNIITDGSGIALSKRRVTVSTSGVVPKMVQLAKETGVKLAVSLHAPNNEIRSQIMPINNQYPIEDVLKACQEYQKIVTSRYITFEYLMLKDINDSIKNAHELISLMKKYKIGVKFNLIGFNSWPGCGYEPTPKNRMYAFAKELEKCGYAAPVRASRGQDILAACGQLKTKKG
ncbi:MAG: 23S rRNA (adenine(2503)-C(2))-methyltransferase RlmN [Lactobacillaceae bacterium]|jgi:23S rRNA (adenine2503-C2)-methyltransferase|nr:23S rRNA (adenine(2503)-C(2))-methyltransferase RlmN [Lactobacillaceae bacterium]